MPDKPTRQMPADRPAEQAPEAKPDAPAEKPAEAVAEEVERGSSDAEHSTYTEVEPDSDERPAPGRQVEQERGTP